jgi:hypothetical protein
VPPARYHQACSEGIDENVPPCRRADAAPAHAGFRYHTG